MPTYVPNAPFGGSGWKVGSQIFSSESKAREYEKSLSGGGGTTQATKTATQPTTSTGGGSRSSGGGGTYPGTSIPVGQIVPPSGGSSVKPSSGSSSSRSSSSKTSSVPAKSATGSGGGYWVDTGEPAGDSGYTIKYNPVTKEVDIPGLFTMPASPDQITRYESALNRVDPLRSIIEERLAQWTAPPPPPAFQPPAPPTPPTAPPPTTSKPPEPPKPPGVEGPPKVEGVPAVPPSEAKPEKLPEGVRRGQAGFESVVAPPVAAPSVDDLVRTYREVFGPSAEEKYVQHYLSGPQFQRVLQGAVPMWMRTDPLWGQYLRRLGLLGDVVGRRLGYGDIRRSEANQSSLYAIQ